MSSELDTATNQLRDDGHREVLRRGAMRLATFLTVGARLARVTGITVHYARDGAMWSSSTRRAQPGALQVNRVRLDQGADLAAAAGAALLLPRRLHGRVGGGWSRAATRRSAPWLSPLSVWCNGST